MRALIRVLLLTSILKEKKMDGVHLTCWPLFYINQPNFSHFPLQDTLSISDAMSDLQVRSVVIYS